MRIRSAVEDGVGRVDVLITLRQRTACTRARVGPRFREGGAYLRLYDSRILISLCQQCTVYDAWGYVVNACVADGANAAVTAQVEDELLDLWNQVSHNVYH